MSFFSKVSKFFSFFAPVAQVALPIATAAGEVNPAVGIVLGIIPGIMSAVNEAEIPGQTKSDAVHAAAQVVFNGLSGILTGDAKESYDTYKPVYQALIDGSVAAFKDAQAAPAAPNA